MSGSADPPTLNELPPEESFPRIGPYLLVKLLGEGGMGEVWLAEQTEPLRRTVALKLIKAGMDTRAVVARFDSERQVLALMKHPNIAKVFDAGTTEGGRPYFVMEYVAGQAITEYADKHRLTIKERLALFLQVCDAVQHAHQVAIIHRDLKPANVLVEEVDRKPRPKIIDFGLAKAMGPQLSDGTMFTEAGAMLGTPAYMSPEQAEASESGVDTRTDVYSLGVILYQLLSGSLPFDAQGKGPAARQALLSQVISQDPPRPSSKIKILGDSSSRVALERREEPRTLERHLRGELDWITLKALEKDRKRRYGSPSELAADIQRYLRKEPVTAGAPGATYRARKFVARHRAWVAVAAGGALLLLGFAVTTTLQARRIARERDRANRQAEASARVTEFMTNMFRVSDPSEARGNQVTAREILDQASTQAASGLAKDPELQAQMMDVMGAAYWNLGLSSRARPLLEKAVDIRTRLLGPEDPATLFSKHRLALVLYGQGQFAEAEKLDREVLEARRRVLGAENPDTLRTLNNLATIVGRQARAMPPGPERDARLAESEKLQREHLDITRRVLGPEHPNTLGSMGNLAATLADAGRYADAEQLALETADLQRRVLGPDHPNTLGNLMNLGFCLEKLHRYGEAEKVYREVVETQKEVLGPEHPDTLLSMDNLNNVIAEQGRYAEAEKLCRETLEVRRRVLGPRHPDTAMSEYELSGLLARQARPSEALAMLRQSVDHGLDPAAALEIENGDDFKSLQGDPRFTTLVAQVKERAAAAKEKR
ncbi:MAG TPA: serine/threonine-protein kinase [Terriglobales bacterium]|nr:serine/threonine-protein kinase [Terriglobales bacterium]